MMNFTYQLYFVGKDEHIMNTDLDKGALEYDLLKLIYETDRMKLLADRIEQLTGYPVYFTTVNWEIIAASSHIRPDEIVTKEMLFSAKKESPHTWSDYVKRKSKISKLISQSPYLTVYNGRTYLFANAVLESNPIGTVVIPGHRLPPEDFDPEVLMVILQVFSVFVTASLGYREHLKYANWEGILYKLLDGEVTSRQVLDQLIKENGVMTEPSSFRIFVFWTRGVSLSLLPSYKKLLQIFRKLQVFRCWVEYDDSVVLLLNDDTPLHEVPDLVGELIPYSFLKENQMHVGYSDLSEDMMMVPLLYQEAKIAINYTNRWNTDNYICSYEACRPYDLLCAVSSPTGSLRHYVSNRIEAMAKYDQSHGTQYVTIVRELVNNRFNLTAASAALFMHKSTLSYHMNKIREHFHIDFEDKLQILHLYLSFFIMDGFLHE